MAGSGRPTPTATRPSWTEPASRSPPRRGGARRSTIPSRGAVNTRAEVLQAFAEHQTGHSRPVPAARRPGRSDVLSCQGSLRNVRRPPAHLGGWEPGAVYTPGAVRGVDNTGQPRVYAVNWIRVR